MESDEDILVTVADIIPAGYCAKGAIAFCARHGLDWPQIVKSGITVRRLRECNDALADKLIAQAKIRKQGDYLG